MSFNFNKDNSAKFYSMEEFFEGLKKFSNNEDLEESNNFNLSNRNNNNYNESEFRDRKKPNFYRSKIREKYNERMKYLVQSSNENYVNEVMKSELANLSKSNKGLKFCFDSLNKKFENEIKDLKLKNLNKTKEIQSTKQILKQNLTQIKLLESKLSSYEKILKETQLTKGKKNNINENNEEKVLIALKEKEELQKEIDERDKIIKSFKEELDSKKELFEDIDKMKNDMESYLETMEKLYKEIEKKDELILNLKKNMELMTSKHQQEIENISKNKMKDLEHASNEEIINEISKSKEAQIKLTKELIEMQKNYNSVKNANIKLQNLTLEAKDMVKKSIESKNNIKEEYNKAIEELVEKYEKQIQLMKVVIVEQNEKYEKQLEEIKNDKNKTDNIEDKIEDIDINEKNKYLEKLKKENILLIQQNLELKNRNDELFQKMNQLPELNNKFDEMFEKVKLLKEENDLLKESLKDKKYLEMLNQEHEEEEKEEKENLNKDNYENNDNDNNEDNKKLSLEELVLLESLLKEMEDNKGEEGQPKKEMDINKLLLLENILKKIENKNGEDDKEEENKKEVEENEEEEKNDEELNLKKQLLLEEMLKSLGKVELNENNEDDKSEDNNKENNLNKRDLDNAENNKPTKIYNKKLLKTSPKIIKRNTKNTEKSKNDSGEIRNEEKEEENEEEYAPNQINENFNLYKPIKEGMLAFNLANKIYSTIIPDKFEEFLEIFDPETSVQYNTLEGLFVIPSNKSNKLYYYSSKKNVINDLFSLKENHSGGCLFLDNTSKYIIALGGYESKAVEKFSFETGKLEQLPEMSTYRSKISCNQIGNKIYCFLGISKENPNKSIVEFLDLDNTEEGWKEIDFINDAGCDIISGMSCINLNDNDLLIIGGLLNDKIPNEALLYFNIEEKKLKKIEKNLPDSDDKVYIFTQNTMFNLFVNGEIISFANIDNNNHVHIIDNNLCYDLYLTPK